MKWTSVKERLPEASKEVLVYIKHGDVIQAYNGVNNWYISRDVRDNANDCYANDARLITSFEVTHWMPLPEAPTE